MIIFSREKLKIKLGRENRKRKTVDEEWSKDANLSPRKSKHQSSTLARAPAKAADVGAPTSSASTKARSSATFIQHRIAQTCRCRD